MEDDRRHIITSLATVEEQKAFFIAIVLHIVERIVCACVFTSTNVGGGGV